ALVALVAYGPRSAEDRSTGNLCASSATCDFGRMLDAATRGLVGSARVSASRPIAPGLFDETVDGPRLLAGACPNCTRRHFPASPWCPYCGSAAVEKIAVGPDARLFLYTVVQSRPPGYRGPLPYGFGVVELPCGLRVVTRLTE